MEEIITEISVINNTAGVFAEDTDDKENDENKIISDNNMCFEENKIEICSRD